MGGTAALILQCWRSTLRTETELGDDLTEILRLDLGELGGSPKIHLGPGSAVRRLQKMGKSHDVGRYLRLYFLLD